MKAVIPVAGMGTRFLPATKASPKEMLPVVDKPVIQYVIEEAVASGITDIVLITGRGKRTLEDHFDRSVELEHLLASKGNDKQVEAMRRISDMADIHYIRQGEPRGLGHAVLCARHHVGAEPFAVLLGDDMIEGGPPGIGQLVKVHEEMHAPVIAVEEIPRERLQSYGVIAPGNTVRPGLHAINDLVEKPAPHEAPSNLGIMGRYVLTPDIIPALKRTPPGRGNEVQLTDAIRLLRPRPMFGLELEGTRLDTGNPLEWLKTNVTLGLRDPTIGPALREHLRALVA